MSCSSVGLPPRWASLRSLRDEAARTAALADAINEHLERDGEGLSFTDEDLSRDEKALEWAEGEELRAHRWLAHRERVLLNERRTL